ncbi:hypothetical protein Taro_046410 [Colocasia esculenta]|uniref:AMP-activated protein kinase glycogen-binding domain-containing protein n=1 Tax=Colocasia esculenta TaxID=4460 RepID=A0A843X637_COLES|nr:hypothetical protein [Colocasia esculenta]
MSLLQSSLHLLPSPPPPATVRSAALASSSLWPRGWGFCRGGSSRLGVRWVGCSRRRLGRVLAMADSAGKMNLNEYMVTLEKPLGIRFALSVDGKIFVHSLKKGGNAERSRIIMVGDALKKASTLSGGGFVDIKDLDDTQYENHFCSARFWSFLDQDKAMLGPIQSLTCLLVESSYSIENVPRQVLKETTGPFSLILERPFSPFPIQQLRLMGDYDILFNKGRVPTCTWNGGLFGSNLRSSTEGNGNPGFVIFSPKYLQPKGWELLSRYQCESSDGQTSNNSGLLSKNKSELVGIFSEEESVDAEWTYGSFPLEEYMKALDRAKGELYYNHSLGMQYSKITEQIYIGSCIQVEADVQTLANVVSIYELASTICLSQGITAILNFQSESERANWGINSESINDACRRHNILMVNYPIREVDSMDLRRKLPLCVGLLLRLLRKNFKVFLTCTTGFERSPACVIAYLHWIQDTALHAAHNFVTGLHSCRPDRAAIVWATWDLIAMVESGRYDGPPTHVVSFVWSNGCREGEEVYLVGDFTGNWKDSIRLAHKGGSRYETEIRLRHGKYSYKFIVGGQWRHSASLPTESDQSGNINNVIRVGDTARIRSFGPTQQYIKDPTIVKVIERPLTEDERFMLAYAARRIAFAICPIRLAPK